MNALAMTLIAALVLLLGCSTTKQPPEWAPLGKKIEGSGFLGDLYPNMQKGEGDQPLRVYRNPKFENPAVFSEYTRVLVDPVVMYGEPDSKLAKLSQEDRNRIASSDTRGSASC